MGCARGLVAGLLAAVSVAAHGQAAETFLLGAGKPGFVANATGTGWNRVLAAMADATNGTASARLWGPGASAGEVVATDSVALAGRAGAIAVSVPTAVSALAVATAAVAVVGVGNVAALVADWMGVKPAVRDIGPMRCVATVGIGWQCDAGGPPDVTTTYWTAYDSRTVAGSMQASCSAYASYRGASGTSYRLRGVGTTNPTYYCDTAYSDSAMAGGSFNSSIVMVKGQGTTSCPAVIDALNPAFSIPAGYAVPGPDGKCPTGRYDRLPPGEVAARAVQYAIAANEIPLVKGLIQAGAELQAAPQQITGPASKVGQPTTSVVSGPAGTTTTVTTPKATYSYGPKAVTEGTEDTVVTTLPDGTVTNLVKTTLPGDPGTAAPDAEQPPPPPDLCKLHPKASGCQELGDVPDPGELPTKDVPVTFVLDSGWGPDTAQCPAPRELRALGTTYMMSWQGLCDVMGGVRPVVIACAYLAAAGIIVGGARAGKKG